MRLLKSITDKTICGTDDISTTAPRKAVRAILLDEGGRMALLYMGKYDCYSVPGGGVEEGEDLHSALKREVAEETGYQCDIIHELGYISESRALHDFTQISYYYVAKAVGERGSPRMTQEEIDEETETQWHMPKDALTLVSHPAQSVYRRKYIQCRDIAVIEEAIRYLRTV